MSTILLTGILCGVGGVLAGLGVAVVFTHHQRLALAQALHDATHDSLTDLANRRALNTHLDYLLRYRHNVGLVLLDLDGFKVINDVLGHAAGDELLRVVAGRLTALPGPITMVARLGGDEFVLVTARQPRPAKGIWSERTGLVAHAARQSLAEPITIDGQVLTVTASAGFAVAADPTPHCAQTRAANLPHWADLAMYHAKGRRSGVHGHVPTPTDLDPPHRPTVRHRDRRT